ncbi:protein N-terminal glutamine amidohydrolase isoform X2 [Sipha flava]|uniref:Protein N-terminal glutamine amidohydrolase n=1 Tax=Sipha flava TaxID=143950 RepID=A0A8B8FQ63_9HEMI|nr:protein N-terminal glutamine amidohydrolase isoform X2 [Sipha flava]
MAILVFRKTHAHAYAYTTTHGEENIWHLAKSILESNKSVKDLKCYVVALSNSNKCVHLWKQTMKENDYRDGLIFWDYHVFCVVKHKNQTWVFDMDSKLPFPVSFAQYDKEAVRHDFPDIKRYFKIIDAQTYIDTFSSDRNHMLKGGVWLSPPPTYPPILNKEKQSNLENIISMEDPLDKFGEVLNLENFKAKFY